MRKYRWGDKDTAYTSNSELVQAYKALMSWESKLEIKLQDNTKKSNYSVLALCRSCNKYD